MLRALIIFALLCSVAIAGEPSTWAKKTMIRTPHGDFSVEELEAYWKVSKIKQKMEENPTDAIKEIRNSKVEII